MFLTITSTSEDAESPATDLGYLLHKHPDRAQKFGLPVGTAHVFYPQADAATCTAALLLEVDPIALVRGRGPRPLDGFSLAQYVNDRPYAASSMLAVALGKVFRTAITGRCEARPDLVGVPMQLDLHVPALPCRGGADVARRMFEPLGWTTRITPIPLDTELGWGDSRYVDLRLSGRMLLSEALGQLYVLLPVLDDAKHYWVSPDEVDKLVRAGEGWLAEHPERTLITERYLRHQRRLVNDAAERFAGLEDASVPDEETEFPADVPLDAPADVPLNAPADESVGEPAGQPAAEPVVESTTESAGAAAAEDAEAATAAPERPLTLAAQRLAEVAETLEASGAQSVADLGCGEGKLLRRLLADTRYQRLLGVDVSHRSLEIASRRLRLDQVPDRVRARIELRQSSLVYVDPGLAGFDAAVLMEVIEHIDLSRLPALVSGVFGTARPGVVLVTTPNIEYNAQYGLVDGETRHTDHRFEWDRGQFQTWATSVAEQYGYSVRFKAVGDEDPEAGPPTQMAVFTAGSAPEVSR
ncbi:3' terminal RNA ribose 2'-O-methyltransferase Hen1 [Kineosporia sp. J2-2]|uniref:Small RNA 2'-O-methyltransferase n=1 Tax=Kineosporia corallincola TaxID=2835133 RepID=A0ABS5TAH1_9ACTN|nr:3' terminal RNA ribose 2'-O-methyltransferase Hen1 [Kineosporia corallincola]MBT0768064.1 3' terminal RNA ribose 2'-O-methyltransferase Hen1 [Kineosporia corallincola]